ncbi:uncharacterized protein LOC111615728 isoform X3 [Centruroides sculpturatus]|uniref:uncharacterized protein LOC111615728 isoform X3 n=1 Tax=Centruroides sculpturatus TaxID=218467 RepID=UPI000C6D9CEC|nr:uncharacterized protein LOC111615728 isoform X3 [Centruroides sculpturatus]
MFYRMSSSNQTEQNEGTKDDRVSDTEKIIQNEVVEPKEILPEQSQTVVADDTDKMCTDSGFPDDSGDHSTIENDHLTDVNMESPATEIINKEDEEKSPATEIINKEEEEKSLATEIINKEEKAKSSTEIINQEEESSTIEIINQEEESSTIEIINQKEESYATEIIHNENSLMHVSHIRERIIDWFFRFFNQFSIPQIITSLIRKRKRDSDEEENEKPSKIPKI